MIIMKNSLIITQGSQAIQLIRELFSLNYRPDNLLVYTVESKANKSFLEFLKYYNINYIITNKDKINYDIKTIINKIDLVISFSNPFILSEDNLQKSTFINFHPGLLPYYKGSFSTVYSMINGEKNVGGTWHYINKEVDKGNIITTITIPIEEDSTAFSLNHKIFSSGIQQLEKVIKLVNKNFKGITQDQEGKFYLNKFPDLEQIKDENLKNKLYFFPPNYI